MSRTVFEKGERVQWPNTQIPAGETGRTVEIEDAETIRHRSGKVYVKYLYRDLIDRVIEDMQSNIDENFDNLCVVVGNEGTGKSNLAYWLCRRFDQDFDIAKSLVYSWEQFIESLTSDDVQRVYWIDEAVLLASGRDWMKESNKILIQCLQIIRSKRLTIIMCIPSFDNIDVYIRHWRTRYLFKALMMKWSGDRQLVRGYGELLIPKSKEERDRLPKDAKAEDSFSSRGFFRHPLMPKEEMRVYEDFKLRNQNAQLDEWKQRMLDSKGGSRFAETNRRIENLIYFMVEVQGMGYGEVADIAGMPESTVRGITARVRNKEEQI